MKKTLCVLSILILVFVVYRALTAEPPKVVKNEQMLEFFMKSRIKTLNEHPEKQFCINLFLFPPFDWDYAYVFSPGTTKKEIEEIIGFKDKNIPKVVQEGYTQMLFVQLNTVVCNIHDEKTCVFSFDKFPDPYIQLYDKDQPMFVMERKEEKIVFTYAGNYVEEGSDMPSENGLACKYSNSPVTLQEVIIDE